MFYIFSNNALSHVSVNDDVEQNANSRDGCGYASVCQKQEDQYNAKCCGLHAEDDKSYEMGKLVVSHPFCKH